MDLMDCMERLDRAFIEQLREGWQRSYGPRVAVRSCDLQWNISSQDMLSYEGVRLADVPALIASATANGIDLGIPAHSLWVSLWSEIPAGGEIAFLHAAEELARARGRRRLVLGADEFHFSPGIPLTTPNGERLAEAARSIGFECAEDADFVGPARSEAVDAYIREAVESEGLRDFRLQPAVTQEELDDLDQFLVKEFPGRWTREFRFWRARSDCQRAFWMTLVRGNRNAREILGFARMAVRRRQEPLEAAWSPGALRLPLMTSSSKINPVWQPDDSCLGPIGIANSLRGQGAGKALLGRVLQTLQANDAELVCIDWTNAFKYYEPLKFEKTRTFLTAWKNGLT